MGVKKSAFASRSERQNFYKLSRTWGDRFRIYHNLPFLNVFTTDDLLDISKDPPQPLSLSDREVGMLKKTSIDFVLCNKTDEPLICMEFDGWLQGVNQGTEYQPFYSPTDSWRLEIAELKLKVAHGSSFPYFVFSSKEFADISPDIPLTLVDGIIGNVVARIKTKEKIEAFQNPAGVISSEIETDLLDRARQSDQPIDWGILFEVASHVEYQPIVARRWELWEELGRPNFTGEILPAGGKCVIHSPDFGDIPAEVILHEFRTPGFSVGKLGLEIAHLLALDKLKRLCRRG